VVQAELAAHRLDLLNHYRWHFVNDLPVDAASCEKFCALLDSMDVPPELRGDMASLAAAGKRGDASEIRRLLPGVYETLAASMKETERDDSAATVLEATLQRLKSALDAGDVQSAKAAMTELRDMDNLSAKARDLYCFLNDALLMGETEKASARLGSALLCRDTSSGSPVLG
jgi:hypothetical protein